MLLLCLCLISAMAAVVGINLYIHDFIKAKKSYVKVTKTMLRGHSES